MEETYNFTGLTKMDKSNSTVKGNDPLLILFMDQSQLIMTVIGLLANIATSITLIKNCQVRVMVLWSQTGLLQSQSIMTVIGLLANIATSITLIKNCQVRVMVLWSQTGLLQSQSIMTVIGLLANIETSITLIKNGQVRVMVLWLQTGLLIISTVISKKISNTFSSNGSLENVTKIVMDIFIRCFNHVNSSIQRST